MSCYALFQGMAASKPTSRLSGQLHFLILITQPSLRGLSRRSGFLPSRVRTLSPAPCLPDLFSQAFGVCLGSVGGSAPSPMQCSTSWRFQPEAVPKHVSGRTSYLRACLAFHPYPQLLRAVFNPQRFGPPPGVTPASAWPQVARFGFGSATTNSLALSRLAFASAPEISSP